MVKHIINRFFQTLLVLLMVATFVFVILRVIGDPAKLLISPDATYADLENTKRILGLDKPISIQYIEYIKDIIRFDFGNSFYFNRPVIEMIAEHLPATLLLAGVSLMFAIPIAIISGIIAAVKRNSLLDNLVTSFTIAGKSIPSFWLGLVLILFFSVTFKVLPPSGYGKPSQLVMPVITMAAGIFASTTRLTRSAMLDVMRQDYMTTARAKGVVENRVIVHHGLRNALLSVVTIIALQIGHMLGGSVVIETVFAWPGIGRLMINAILSYDFPLIQACAIFMALMFAIVNFIADTCYTLIDPRIKK